MSNADIAKSTAKFWQQEMGKTDASSKERYEWKTFFFVQSLCSWKICCPANLQAIFDICDRDSLLFTLQHNFYSFSSVFRMSRPKMHSSDDIYLFTEHFAENYEFISYFSLVWAHAWEYLRKNRFANHLIQIKSVDLTMSSKSKCDYCSLCRLVSSHFETKTNCRTFPIVATATLFWSSETARPFWWLIKLYVRISLWPNTEIGDIRLFTRKIFNRTDLLCVLLGRLTARRYLVRKTNAIWCTDRTQKNR